MPSVEAVLRSAIGVSYQNLSQMEPFVDSWRNLSLVSSMIVLRIVKFQIGRHGEFAAKLVGKVHENGNVPLL